MLFIFAGLCGGGVALLRGGRLNNLSNLAISWSALPLLALAIQIYVIYGPGKNDAGSYSFPALLILGSYLLLMFTVLKNRHLPGIAWLGLGAALNFFVILLNGGWMPVQAEALAAAGIIDTPSALAPGQRVWATKDVVVPGHEIRLRWLSDLFVASKPGIFSAVFSAGDVLIMFGLFQLIQGGMLNQAAKTS